MFEKNYLTPPSVVSPMGYCSSSECNKGCNGDSGSAISDTTNNNTDPSGS